MIAIPTFPKFDKLSVDHYDLIFGVTEKYDAYSDFNFISLFAWNTDNSAELSMLNDNLVIKLPDYLTGEDVLSLLGDNKIDKTINTLFEFTSGLKLVPEVVVNSINEPAQLIITEDPDNFDYIFSLSKLSKLEGHEYKWKRKRLNRLLRDYGKDLNFTDLSSDIREFKSRVLSIFDEWAKDDTRKAEDIAQEREAIIRLIDHSKNLPKILLTILRNSSSDIGFSINELGEPMSTCHFQKTILGYRNMDIVLTNHISRLLYERGSEDINWEQDLGIAGLRSFKQSYLPTNILKKYRITKP